MKKREIVIYKSFDKPEFQLEVMVEDESVLLTQ